MGRSLTLPPGTPEWITSDLIVGTIRVWQRYYPEKLGVIDAIAILANVGRLVDVVRGGCTAKRSRGADP